MNKKVLKQMAPNAVILDPLPREDELLPEIDSTPFAKYFLQAENGLYMRMAIFSEILRLDKGLSK